MPPIPEPIHEKINLAPKLPYINVSIGLPVNRGPFYDQLGMKTKVLLDSGAGKTTMNKNFYLRLMQAFNSSKESLTVVPNYGIKTILSNTMLITGMTKYRLWISVNPPIYRDGTAMVIEGIAEDFILGSDVIMSDWTKALTPNNLIMSHPKNEATGCIHNFRKENYVFNSLLFIF